MIVKINRGEKHSRIYVHVGARASPSYPRRVVGEPALNFICQIRRLIPAAPAGARGTIDYFGPVNSDLKQNARARERVTQLILRIDCAHGIFRKSRTYFLASASDYAPEY